MTAFGSSRLLLDTFGIIGAEVRDGSNLRRIWKVQSLYAPIRERAIGGIRARVIDQYDFSTFVNQRDLEVLLDLAQPGQYCEWLGKRYVGPGDPDWYGLCADHDDLMDDLHERELLLRCSTFTDLIPNGYEMTRRVHQEEGVDVEELLAFLWDFHPETGVSPDTSLEKISHRWSRIEQQKVRWR